MGFTVQYGPISAALMLANRAGIGQFNQQQFSNDNEFLRTLNQQQQTEDARRSTDMQNALGYDQARSHYALANAEMQRNMLYNQNMMAYRNANLASVEGYRNSLENSRATNAGINQKKLEDKENNDQNTEAARTAMGPEAKTSLDATNGRMLPPNMTPAGTNAATAQEQAVAKDLQMKRSAMEYTPTTIFGKKGTPQAKPGMDIPYKQVMADIQNYGNGTAADPLVKRGLRPPPPPTPQQQRLTAAAASGGMTAPDGSKIPGGNGEPLPAPVAMQILQAAGGDKQKARQLAAQLGWVVGN